MSKSASPAKIRPFGKKDRKIGRFKIDNWVEESSHLKVIEKSK